jgi:hypothetical protein
MSMITLPWMSEEGFVSVITLLWFARRELSLCSKLLTTSILSCAQFLLYSGTTSVLRHFRPRLSVFEG